MHRMKAIAIFGFVLISTYYIYASENIIHSFDLNAGWKIESDSTSISEDSTVAVISNQIDNGLNGISINFDTATVAGKLITFSAEVWKDIQPSEKKYMGGKAVFRWSQNSCVHYGGVPFGEGTEDWKTYAGSLFIPSGAENIQLTIFIQDAVGTIKIRNVQIDTGDAALPIYNNANMGFADECPGDGKGGWTDQGPDNDAKSFDYKQTSYGGVPFDIINPISNNGNGLISFTTKTYSGISEASYPYPTSKEPYCYLYLLHTSTHNNDTDHPIGYIDIIGDVPNIETYEIKTGRDVANWWYPKRIENACPVSIWKNNSCGSVGLYLSKFRCPDRFKGKLIRFRSGKSDANWLLLAATLSAHNYPFPKEKEKVVINAGEKWRSLEQTPGTRIAAGSALDLSWLTGHDPAGYKGRVIINKEGEFAFENEPDTAVRFMGHNWIMMYAAPYLTSKDQIEEYAEQIKRAGYNLVRLHFITAYLFDSTKMDFALNPEKIDTFDYFIYALKNRGIYVSWDVLCSRLPISQQKIQGDTISSMINKMEIHFNSAARDNYAKGCRILLNHMNPYTKMTLADDPTLAFAVLYNEQEFAFIMHNQYSHIAWPRWHEFLQKRYQTIDKLKESWGDKAHGISNFNEIKTCFGIRSKGDNITAEGKDVAQFLTECEVEFYAWAKKALLDAGFKGPVANYNMDKSLRYDIVRDGNDFIAMNDYHAHPMKDMIDPGSSIANRARIIRAFSSTRRYGKPFVATEHAHGFWNRYRYEQGLIMGGYGCFQNLSGLVCHSLSVTLEKKEEKIRTFCTSTDPVIRASEYIMSLLFLRRDVKSAPNNVRIIIDPQRIYSDGSSGDSLNPQESALALVTGFSTEVKRDPVVLKDNQFTLPAYSGSPLITKEINGIGVRQILDEDSLRYNMNSEITNLKTAGMLPTSNRSVYSPDMFFESSTGEIVLDAKNEYLSINTPRTQGICAKSETKVKFPDFEILEMSTRGSLVAISIDKDKVLKEAKRVILIYITNAFNSGMIFTDDTYRQVINYGNTPVLLETGNFMIRLHNDNAPEMKCYALKDTGERRELLPSKNTNSEILLDVNTANLHDAPSIYYELSTN